MTKLKAMCMTATSCEDGDCLYVFHLPEASPIKWSLRPFITITAKPDSYSVGKEYTINLEVTKAEK